MENYIYMTVKSILEMVDFYIFYLVIIPYFPLRKSFTRFLLITILYAAVYTSFYAVTLTYSDVLLGTGRGWDGLSFQFLVAGYYTILYIFLGGLFKLSIDGIISQRQKLQLEQQNVKNELALLRSQINPHFLFNTLNTIHSFVNSNHPKAAQAVIKLSDIMRYMLYDAVKDRITLEQEIDYLRSYIALQNFRIEKPDYVKFDLVGNVVGIIIPPMLLIPFVENAYKHGKRKVENGIHISLEISDEKLLFRIRNDIDPIKTASQDKNSGIGLNNLKRRLELLYPENHDLKIEENNNEFIATLHLKLS